MKTTVWIAVVMVVAGVTAYVTRRLVVARSPSLYETVGTVQEIMEGIVEPNADILFESVAVVNDASGTTERAPKTDAEWERVEHSVVALAEAANLLEMPGRLVASANPAVTQSGALPELTPAQILQKIQMDPAKWNHHADALRQQAVKALEQVRQRHVPALFDAGADLDLVCENCHREYWYPNAPAGTGSR